VRHPVEIFDTDILRLMSSAVDAAVQTVRLTGEEPGGPVRVAMARRVIEAASSGDQTRLSLTEAALDGPWT
jgi:molybdenum cofactor biosynthesis enzyme MoaA